MTSIVSERAITEARQSHQEHCQLLTVALLLPDGEPDVLAVRWDT